MYVTYFFFSPAAACRAGGVQRALFSWGAAWQRGAEIVVGKGALSLNSLNSLEGPAVGDYFLQGIPVNYDC